MRARDNGRDRTIAIVLQHALFLFSFRSISRYDVAITATAAWIHRGVEACKETPLRSVSAERLPPQSYGSSLTMQPGWAEALLHLHFLLLGTRITRTVDLVHLRYSNPALTIPPGLQIRSAILHSYVSIVKRNERKKKAKVCVEKRRGSDHEVGFRFRSVYGARKNK